MKSLKLSTAKTIYGKEISMIDGDRLKRIADIIERVDQRAMAADGPVTPTLQEMRQDEISEIYLLASEQSGLKNYKPSQKGLNVATDKQCSELFEMVFDSCCGGIVRQCACGITYFEGDSPHFDAGELEGYLKNAQKEPTQWIERDQGIGTMEIGGDQIVFGCSCDRARQYEKFIIAHRHQLSQYLNGYAQELREEASVIGVKDV